MNMLVLQNKIQLWTAKQYTRLISKSFESVGRGSILFFSSRFDGAERISIGSNVHIRSTAWLNAVDRWCEQSHPGRIEIHDNVVIMGGVQISANNHIVIENGCGISRNCTIVDHNHDFRPLDVPIVLAPLTEGLSVKIGRHSLLGVGCLIGPGVTIGEHCFIGANSVVTQDIPPFCFASGNPAEIRRRYNPESGRWGVPEQEEA